ncbi:MAG: zinc ribbon domain-containing protein [Treponema sp.]|nr:zinc ribbon domain-containing protein [Treponema sp.]
MIFCGNCGGKIEEGARFCDNCGNPMTGNVTRNTSVESYQRPGVGSLASGFILEEKEKLVMEIEAELWASSSNPIARFVGKIQRIIASILGFKQKGYWVITDKRVIEISTQVVCWCVTLGRHIKYVLPSSVKEIGYTREPTFGCFCPAYNLYYESFTQKSSILLKDADEYGALRAANAFYNAISAG